MAFTFEQFEAKAKELGLADKMSPADLQLARKNPDAGMSLLQYKQDYANAANDQARALANEGAERIRTEYGGYSGGRDGSGYYLSSPSPSSFTPKEKPEYTYDMESDPVYQAYAKQHAREGQRAVQEAIGQAAAMTGGMPSTAAVTAATQAGDYYAAQMADKVPELEQNAYARYLDSVAQNNYENEFGYQQHMDQIDHNTLSRTEALEKAMLAAEFGDYSFLEELGIEVPAAEESAEGGYTGLPVPGTEPDTRPAPAPDPEREYAVTFFPDLPDDPGTIARAQKLLGIFGDGEWSVEAQQKAQDAGYSSFNEIVKELEKNGKTNESSTDDKLTQNQKIRDWLLGLYDDNATYEQLLGKINGRGDLTSTQRKYAEEILNQLFD